MIPFSPNGCGSKGGPLGWFRPIHWFGLEGLCDHHDELYNAGSTAADRKAADQWLRSSIEHLADQQGAGFFKRLYFRFQCNVYYAGVRLFGAFAFNYGAGENPVARLARPFQNLMSFIWRR